MPKQFPLHTVLEHRLRQEEQRQQEVARAEAHLAKMQGLLRLAEAAHRAILADITGMQRATQIDGHAISAAQQRIQRALIEIEQAQMAVTSSQATLTATRSAAIAASQGRLAIEKLRDAFHTTIQQEAAHTEAERLGEIGLMRWLARQPKGDSREHS